MDFKFPFYKVEGDPYGVGFQHGQFAKERIQKSLEIYRRAFLEMANIQWKKAMEIAKTFVPVIQEYDSEAIEEVRGIAKGANCEFEEIVALNSRTEVMFLTESIPSGCTTVSVLPDASQNGHTLLGQNWDWKPDCLESAILLEIKRENGLRAFNFVEAGMVGRNGMNSAGIGVVANFLETDRDRKQSGVPLPFIRRKILASRIMAEAMKALMEAKKTSSTNCLIGSKEGVAIDIEATPENFYVLYPDKGLLVHANHFVYPHIREKDTSRIRFPDTLYRDWRLKQLLEPKRGKIAAKDLQESFSDHMGYPRSICRHPEMEAKKSDQIQTVGSIIMDLNNGEIQFAAGCPCESGYKPFKFEMS